MIRLRPTLEEQTFSIIPSSYNLTGATLSLVENGTDIAQNDISYSWQLSDNENFIEITISESNGWQECNILDVYNLSNEEVHVPYISCVTDENGDYLERSVLVEPLGYLQMQTLRELGDITGLPITISWFEGGPLDNSQVKANLKEDSIYTLELTKDNDVLYRDMVYVTSKVNKNEAFSYPTTYKEHSNGNSEYIIL